jgi:hypothetical protein
MNLASKRAGAEAFELASGAVRAFMASILFLDFEGYCGRNM